MRAVIIDEPGAIRVGERPDPSPGPEGLVVKVGATGICGTDLHIADGHFAPTPYPIVPGHEFSGEVVAVGPDAPGGFAVGDRVAVDPTLVCGACGPCRAGHGNLCANWNATGDTVDGAFAEYVAVPANTAYPLPDHVGYREGALVEPLSCAVHGVRRAGVEAGESALVVGAGTMGLLLQQLLQRGGAEVDVVDRNDQRLAVAKGFGARATATSLDALADQRYDVVADVTGVAPVIEQSFDLVQRGGRFLVFGVAPEEDRVRLSPFRIYNDEITVVGSMAVLHSYGRALDLVSNGAVETGPLLTHAMSLEEFPQALQAAREGVGMKVQVLPNGEL
jgi:2-desacetyl-2-hydroxyethyl bacteriochlorophyllide A dehydrogenase